MNLRDRLSKLEGIASREVDRPSISLEHITDADLHTLAELTDEQLARVTAHPDVIAMQDCTAFTVEQGARMAELAREVLHGAQ